MHPISPVELEVLNRLASAQFEGVEKLRAQISYISEVEPNCSCGCPSFTPVLDRSFVPPAPFSSLLPSELNEEERDDGAPRTVIWFADAAGFITNVECIYYDDPRAEWPDFRNCRVLTREL